MAHPLAAPLTGFWQLVHGPLAHWANTRPNTVALMSESRSLTFPYLYQEVMERSACIDERQLPLMPLLDTSAGTLESVIDFLAIIASGRCAAVADPEWPATVLEQVQHCLPAEAATPLQTTPLTAFYTGFTSGSTGVPKGFMRHHQSWTESFRVSIQDFGPVATQRVLAPGRMSHSLFLFGVMHALWCGEIGRAHV